MVRTTTILASTLALAGCLGGSEGIEALTPEETHGTPDRPRPAASPAQQESAAELDAPPPEETSPVAPFIGTYRWVGGLPEQRVLWGKIQKMADTFNFVAEGIVRDKLAAGNTIAKELRIEGDAEKVVVYRDGKGHAAPMDGSASVSVRTSTGDKMDMTYHVEPGVLEERYKSPGRSRVNRYELDGDKLTIKTTITASQLPYPLVYDLTYERIQPSS